MNRSSDGADGAPNGAISSVLVVDDEPAIRETVADLLRFEGYQVETAIHGADALRMVEESRPAAVLLDMRMPVLDGWGFAQSLRDRGIDLPIVVMTAAQDASRWANEIGANGYLSKPFDLLDVLTAVEGIVGAPHN